MADGDKAAEIVREMLDIMSIDSREQNLIKQINSTCNDIFTEVTGKYKKRIQINELLTQIEEANIRKIGLF